MRKLIESTRANNGNSGFSSFEESLPVMSESPCELCMKTGQNGKFHYLSNAGYATMFICSDRHVCLKLEKYHDQRVEDLKKASRMSPELLSKSIFNFTTREWWQAKIISILSVWNIEDESWLLLCGGPGTGKTHLAAGLSNIYINTGYLVLFTYYSEIMEAVRFKDSAFLEKVREAPILFLDDLYKGNITFAEIKETAALINYRYNNNLPTFITTEKTPNELFEIDEAIAGRIIQKCGDNWTDFPHDKESDYRIKDYLGMFD